MIFARLLLAALTAIAAALPGQSNAQQHKPSDFKDCGRADNGTPYCRHRQTDRITIVSEAMYQAVTGAAQPSPPMAGPANPSAPGTGSAQPAPPGIGPTALHASSPAQACTALKNWLNVYFREVPDSSARSGNMFVNLLRDEYFIPYIGAPYLSLTDQQMGQMNKLVRSTSCDWRGQELLASSSLISAFHDVARQGNRQTLSRIASGLEWRARALATIAQTPPTVVGFQALYTMETDAKTYLALLWPKEQSAFQQAVVARRRAVAEEAIRPGADKPATTATLDQLKELDLLIEPAREAGQIIRAHIDATLSRYIDAALAEASRFPPNDEGKGQFDAWRKTLEAGMAPFSRYPAASSLQERIAAEAKKLETRTNLAILDQNAPPSKARLDRINALQQASDTSVAERARAMFPGALAAFVQVRLDGMPNFPETRAGFRAFTEWRAQFERELEPYRSQEPVPRAFARLAEQDAKLTKAAQSELVNEVATPSLARLAALREVLQTSKEPAISAKARTVLEQDLSVLVAQRQAEMNALPSTGEALQRLDAWIEAFRRDFGPYGEFKSVEQAMNAAMAKRPALARLAELAEVQRLKQSAASFESAEALAKLAASHNSDVAAQARAAAEVMIGALFEREIAAAPTVTADLEGMETLARWASALKQRIDKFNGYQAAQRAMATLVSRLKDQRAKSLEPFAMSLKSAFSLDTFAQAKQRIDQLPRDIVPDLPSEFEKVHAEELRVWRERKGYNPQTTAPAGAPPPGGASPPGARSADPLGGLVTPGAQPPPSSGAPAPSGSSATPSAKPGDPLAGLLTPGPQLAPAPSTSPARSTPQAAPEIPAPYGDALRQAISGTSSLTAGSLLFFGGAASDLLERCNVRAGDRAELARLASAAQDRAVYGSNYSSRDLMGTVQGNVAGAGIFAAGVEFARQFECPSAAAEAFAARIAEASRKRTQGTGGGPSTFVKTCTPSFNQEKCQCIAQIGQAVIPDIYQSTYNRSMIKRIVDSSPVVALKLAFACQIGNY